MIHLDIWFLSPSPYCEDVTQVEIIKLCLLWHPASIFLVNKNICSFRSSFLIQVIS